MKKVVKDLRKQEEKLREIIQVREDYVCDRSEKWQESERCEEYMDKTFEISDRADELDGLIDEIKKLI